MDKAKLREYAELKLEAKKIEARIKELAPEILEEIDERPVETPLGTFVRAAKRTYIYPQSIKEAEENLKTAKKVAEQTGDADYTETFYLRFNSADGASE